MRRGCGGLVLTACMGCGLLPPVHWGPPGTSETHIVVTVRQGPVLVAVNALRSKVDSGGLHSESTLKPSGEDTIVFPTRYVVVGRQLQGETLVAVDALDAAGQVVGRARGTVEVQARQGVPLELSLRVACNTTDQCDDGLFCTGQEACVDGVCLPGPLPCPTSAVSCVAVTCQETLTSCVVEPRHDRCPSVSTDAGVLQRYCDPVNDCSNGRPCQMDEDCQDGLVCNGQERCLGFQCAQGDPFGATDGNPCTLDACVEGTDAGVQFIDLGDGTPCVGPAGAGICLTQACAPSICGDGFTDPNNNNETCDDGNDNPNDGCHACERTRFDGVLFAGLGPSGGQPDQTVLRAPAGVAFDQGTLMYVADGVGQRIWRVDPSNGLATVLAGSGVPGFAGDGTTGTQVQFSSPRGLAVDTRRDVYVADTGNHRVRRISPNGRTQTVVGTGEPGFSGDSGPAYLARLDSPSGLAVDSASNIYLADRGNHRVRRISNDVITTVCGTGTPGYSSDGVAGTAADLNKPEGVALDVQGNLLIADSLNHRVRRLGTNGIITTVAGTGVQGFSGDGAQATAAMLDTPVGVAYAPAQQSIYIATAGDHRVRVIDRTGTITTVMGTGQAALGPDTGPAAACALDAPGFLAVDGNGTLHISDTGNGRIRRLTANGDTTTALGLRTPQPQPANPTALSTLLIHPTAVFQHSSGALYAAETYGHRVVRLDVNGSVTTVAGTGTPGFDGDNGPGAGAHLNAPRGLWVDAPGNVWVADSGNHRVRRIDAVSGTITTVAGTGTPGYSAADDGAAAVAAQLNGPRGLARDAVGNLYVADTLNHRIRRVDLAGNITTWVGNGVDAFAGDNGPATLASISQVEHLAVAADGSLLFSDPQAHRLRAVSLAGTVSTVAGTGVPASNGDGAAAALAALHAPSGVVADGVGNVFVAERDGHRVRLINSAGMIATVAGNGLRGAWGDGQPATTGRLAEPRGLALAADGAVLVADSGNGLVRKVRTDGTLQSVLGQVHPGDGPLDRAFLQDPSAAIFITPQTLLVADGGGGRLRLVDLQAQTLTTVAGYPHDVAANARAAAGSRFLFNAAGLALDAANGHLYVSERDAHIIRRFTLTDAADPSTWTVDDHLGRLGEPGRANGTLDESRLMGPAGLVFDAPHRTLWVAEAEGHDVRRVLVDEPLSADCVTVAAGLSGLQGFAVDNGMALDAMFNTPMALALGADGSLYIADTLNHRVRRLAPNGTISTIMGGGNPGSVGMGSPAFMFPVDTPRGLAVDAAGNLFVGSRHSLRVVNPAPGQSTVRGLPTELLVQVHGAPQREFPANQSQCLTGFAVASEGAPVYVLDACAGWVIRADRHAAP